MLKYSIKLSNDSIQQKELDWGEKYLDPNLSFVSGVTSASNHLEKYDRISVSNNIINSSSIVSVETENVLRQGYVIVKGKQYEVYSGSVIDYSTKREGDKIDYTYTFINGKYYYLKNDVFTINDWLTAKDDLVSVKTVTMDSDGKLDTIYWIEDGKVTIDGITYDYDFNRSGLTYSIANKMLNSGETLTKDQITICDNIEYKPYSSTTKYQEVTKFILKKDEDYITPFDRITHCKYFYYVMYKNHYCPIKQVFSGDAYSFKCEIPKYVLNATAKTDDTMETEPYDVFYYTNDGIESDVITNDNVHLHGVRSIDDLKNVISFIKVDDAVFYVEHDIQNTNDGKQIAIYLQSGEEPISIGNTLRFKKTDDTFYTAMVQKEQGSDSEFVVFGNKKWYIEKKICDKVIINGNEYAIDYVNGKENGNDCLVTIGDEKIPFKISGSTSGNTLVKYGKIILSKNSWATDVSYSIKSYDGVVINGKKYIVHDYDIVRDYDDGYRYAELDDLNREYIFTVNDIKGSSLLICSPYLTTMEYTQDFIDTLSYNMCNDLVSNQNSFILYSKNKVFGDKEITKELAFLHTNEPKSSDDYYDLFSNFVIYNRNGFINVPLKFENVIGGNPLQDNLVERDFFEKEKKNAINPIVDMEKDVYHPKFIHNDRPADLPDNVIDENAHTYKGSSTNFKPIRQINLNLHFRTRDVGNFGNWKVKESYNDIEASGKDNWFITDFYPYKYLQSSAYTDNLQESSDLLGLLFFDNYDVYYQKQKLAKSFIRLSYYDSTDPQTQNLLATSTIFMDKHSLFKKYIDNSRKNINKFILVEDGDEITELNAISVFSEYYGASTSKTFEFSSETEMEKKWVKDMTKNMVEKMAEDTNRLSSRLAIKNKYETDTSSEGFYIYMFKEYSEKLHPKPIYMKVEFNHAGVGKTIPFSIPMKWEEKTSGETHPTTALTLTDEELKKGYPLSYVYAQSYIPLYAVYDFKNKEYAYVFDDRYFINHSKNKIYNDGVINLNLFELKIQNENDNDNKTPTDDELKSITKKQQIKAAIDINTAQFSN